MNGGARSFSGSLRSADLNGSRLKATSPGCDCVHWHRRGEARLEIPAAAELVLALETPLRGAIVLSGALGDGVRSEIVIDPYESSNPKSWSLGNAGVLEGRVEGSLQLTTWWLGRPAGSRAQRQAPGPELIQQLRALGYAD